MISFFYTGAPPTTNGDVQPSSVKRRRASKRHCPVNQSTSRDDSDSKLFLQVDHNGSRVIDHLYVASPANGFTVEYETSPDSGVHANSNEKAGDQEMSCVQSSNNNFEQTIEKHIDDHDGLADQCPLFDENNGLLRDFAESAYSPGRLEDFMAVQQGEESTLPENQNPLTILGCSDQMWVSYSQRNADHANVEQTEMSNPFPDSDLDDFDVEYDQKIVTDGVKQRKISDAAVTQPRVSRISVVRARVRRSSFDENRPVAFQRFTLLKEMFHRNYGLAVVAGCIGAAAICRMFV